MLAPLARGVSGEALLHVAAEAIQLHGGIAFTWEHDSHLYFRRALGVAACSGTARATPRPTRPASCRPGWPAGPDLDLPEEGLASATGPRCGRSSPRSTAWTPPARRTRLVEGGYLVPHWPPPWGRAARPRNWSSTRSWAGRTPRSSRPGHRRVDRSDDLEHGTPEQVEQFVGPTLRGELVWCQLFSEPGAGSDLAALRPGPAP